MSPWLDHFKSLFLLIFIAFCSTRGSDRPDVVPMLLEDESKTPPADRRVLHGKNGKGRESKRTCRVAVGGLGPTKAFQRYSDKSLIRGRRVLPWTSRWPVAATKSRGLYGQMRRGCRVYHVRLKWNCLCGYKNLQMWRKARRQPPPHQRLICSRTR